MEILNQLKIGNTVYDLAAKYDFSGNDIENTYINKDEISLLELAVKEAENVNATITEENVFEVTDRTGAKKTLDLNVTGGTSAGFGEIAATVDNSIGTPNVTVTTSGTNEAKNFTFAFTGLKGEKGEKGEVGMQGNSGVADASNKILVNDAITGGETDFLSAEVGKLGILTYDCSKGGSVTHATLQDAINSVPTTFQKVGLTITYKSGDTIHHYTLKANSWSTDPANWFSVEDKLNDLVDKTTMGTELDKKFDKESVAQESGSAKDKVMSQKATTTAIADETTRALAAEKAILFDVSANNSGVVFESLSALLSSSNLSTLIPISVRHGGMSIRFIQGSEQSSDNKYVQWRYMRTSTTNADIANVKNWQGVDSEPTSGSKNLVESGGVFNKMQNIIKQKDDDSSSALNICDGQGYSILQLKEGHVKTKNFDSRYYSTKPKYLYKLDENAADILLGGFSNNNGVLYSNGHYGIENSAILNKEYAISTKYIVIDFSLEEHSIAYFHTVAGIDGNARVGSTMVSIDFDNKKLRFHVPSAGGTITSVYKETIISSLVDGEKYRICISKSNWNITTKIYDLKSFEVVANLTCKCYDWNTTIDGVGYMYDKFSFFSESANITIYDIIVSTPKIDSCELMIYGDSITEGLYATTESKSYGMLVGQHFDINKVLVSGRASGTIKGVLNRIRSEVAVIRPKYVSVMIGTNGGNTVDNIVELCKLIISFGAIPIINTIIGNRHNVQTSINNVIRTAIQVIRNAGNKVLSVRLDDATALNKDASQGTDTSYFTDKEGLHPNDAGHQAMANQFYIDIPEIFNW